MSLLSQLRNQPPNIYLTQHGLVTLIPELSTSNDFGFILKTEIIVEATESTRIADDKSIMTLANTVATILGQLTFRHQSTSNQIIPITFQDHLVIIAPPPQSTLPMRYPLSPYARTWLSPSNTWKLVLHLRTSRLAENFILRYPHSQTGNQSMKAGDIVFINRIGYYISEEIGRLPPEAEWMSRYVALAGYTAEGEMVLLFTIPDYVRPPVT
jgi:hypothetical protein